jgi:nitrile hydratase accessory protein
MLLDPKPALRAVNAVPGIPRDADGPVFREPWEAQAFAMALVLYDRGMCTWPDWAAALADEIKRAQAAGDPDTGETYYQHWLNATGLPNVCCSMHFLLSGAFSCQKNPARFGANHR